MRVAVLTLTRDRLAFTKHCFEQLHDLAGCDFDHFVLDQGSTDGTHEWLGEWQDNCKAVLLLRENIGISKGMNRLLGMLNPARYDVIVKFDNDCELVVDDTLAAVCDVVSCGYDWLASPLIQGLNAPPGYGDPVNVLGYRVAPLGGNIGGIFLAAPAAFYEGFRFNEVNPIWGMDDVEICQNWHEQGHRVGYLLDFPANHYLTTEGQKDRDPGYFERKLSEFSGRS